MDDDSDPFKALASRNRPPKRPPIALVGRSVPSSLSHDLATIPDLSQQEYLARLERSLATTQDRSGLGVPHQWAAMAYLENNPPVVDQEDWDAELGANLLQYDQLASDALNGEDSDISAVVLEPLEQGRDRIEEQREPHQVWDEGNVPIISQQVVPSHRSADTRFILPCCSLNARQLIVLTIWVVVLIPFLLIVAWGIVSILSQ